MKRVLSFTLALILILSLFSGIRLPAEAASASYNKGKRDQVCTALSSKANSYYTGSYSYSALSSLSGSNLRSKLRTLVTTGRKTVGYDGLKTYFPHTDAFEGSSSKLRLFYCDGTTSSKWDGAKTWNREHMWPDSKGGSAMEGDLHAMRPTDPKTNSTRGNSKYGKVTGGKAAYTNEANGSLLGGYYVSGTYEPLDFSKGDCARTILYDYVVTSSMSSVTVVFQDEKTLLEWCALDPVDTYEMSRNDVAQEIQGCRNPFVDYPELAWLLLGKEIPDGLTTPTGGVGESFTITASSNNTAYGTVELRGSTIVAKPAQGCYADSYTILSGKATVTREDNNFIVTAESDCSIRINFMQKTAVTLGFNGLATPLQGYAGDVVTLPKAADVAPYTFLGWVEEAVDKTTLKPTYYKGGASYTLTHTMDLYPLYTFTEGSTGSGAWTLVDSASDIRAGLQILIAHNGKGKVAGDITTTYMVPEDATFSSDLETITYVPETASVLTVGGQKDAWTLTDRQGRVLGCSDAKKLGWGAGTLTWKIEISSEGADIFSTISTYGRILYNISAPRFTTYTGNPATHLPRPQIYMMDGSAGTLYYTSFTVACDHNYTSVVTAPTCTEDGFTTYTCTICGNSYVGDAVEALGHSYTSAVTAPTCTEAGFTTYTCAVCDDSYVGDAVEALGHTWDEGVVTLAPTQEAEGEMTFTCLICHETKTETIPVLPTEGCAYGDKCGSHTFTDMPELGNWAHEGIDFVVDKGLFNGMSKDTFAPGKTMTRAMLVTVLWRSAGEPEAETATFTDVPAEQWYTEAIAWAAEKGVVTGYTDGTFRPDNQITREQLATILFRYTKLFEMDPPQRADLDSFPDSNKVQAYAVDAMQWAVARGLINGVYDNSTEQTLLRPENSATRGQVATILMRFLKEA